MVAAFDYCLHGKGGAAPSIDTAMHGLVDAAHVDHLHPDSGIAIATAADGEAADQGDLRRPGRLGAVAPARLPARPRHRRDQGGATRRRSAASSAATASPRGATTSEECRAQLAVDHRHRRGVHRRARQAGAVRPAARRVRRAAGGRAPRQGRGAGADHPRPSPRTTGRWSATSPTPRSCSTSWRAPSTRGWRRSARRCPDHFLRTKVKPLVLDLPATATVEESIARLARAARGLPRGLPAATTTGTRRRTSPAIRGADPLIVLVPGRRHVQLRQGQADRPGGRRVLRQRDQRDARRRGRLDLRPDRRGGEVPHRVLGARGGQAAADAEAEAARHAGSRWSPARRPASARPSPQRLAAEGACVVIADLDAEKAPRPRPRRSATADVAVGVAVDVTDADAVQAAVDAAVLAFGGIDLVVNNAGLSLSQVAAGDHRGRLGPAARRDGQGLVPGLPGRGEGA